MIPVCPKCDIGLFILHFRNVELDYCDRCRGVWLDAGELEALAKSAGEPTDELLVRLRALAGTIPPGRKNLCPRCDQPMEECVVTTPGAQSVALDRCSRGHGLWFDANELAQVLALNPAGPGARKVIDHLNEVFGRRSKPEQGEKP